MYLDRITSENYDPLIFKIKSDLTRWDLLVFPGFGDGNNTNELATQTNLSLLQNLALRIK